VFSLVPPSRDYSLYSGFVQDEIALCPQRLYLTLGTTLEHHYYAGFLALPDARLAWTPDDKNTFWAAASLAERVPADLDVSEVTNLGGFPGPGGVLTELTLLGNPKVKPEALLGYQAGYRSALGKRLSIDLALYYSHYYHQETSDPGTPFFVPSPAPPHFVLPLINNNRLWGESHGLEAFSNWKISQNWVLSPGYAFEQFHMHLDPDSSDTLDLEEAQGSNPVHSAQLLSHYVLPRGFSWDVSTYYVGRLADPVIPSYTRVDTQLTWQWKKRVSLSAVGQNLAKEHHLEFVEYTGAALSTLMQRSGFGKITWFF
jgi:iron complex outermembrane recepter protein